MSVDSIEDIISDIRQGKMVILMDDEDRENEGDLIMAATDVRAEDINFMARYGRGLICLTLTEERCRQLRLPLMVHATRADEATNFTVSIEAAHGVTTGISAADRAATIRCAIAADARPEDIVFPGHVFPLMARPGGVLTRAGHTEAGCDLARLAGKEPAAVIVEILNEDGSMARRADLEVFARRHTIKIGTVADLIHYRLAHEKSLEQVGTCSVATAYGDFKLIAFQDQISKQVHLALVLGEIKADTPMLVRVHVRDSLCDIFSLQGGDCGWPLPSVLRHIAEAGAGVAVILYPREDASTLIQRIRAYDSQTASAEEPPSDLRNYGLGAQILSELGVRRMRVLSAPKKLHALSGFGLEVVEYVQCDKH